MKGDTSFHRNLLIVANAGSGKTYHLVTRCIQLLQRGEQPEEILALTFTRAAAAEFLQKLFERIAQAANDPEQLQILQEQLGGDCPAIDANGCIKLLRQLIESLPRLSMGTLDQHFGRIVRAFPFELGLAREVELLDDAEKEDSQRRALEELFARGTQTDLREFIEILRQQSRNRADQSALKSMSHAANSLHVQFIETPTRCPWGDAKLIWPTGCPILNASDITTAVQKFDAAINATHPDLSDKSKVIISGWLESALEYQAPSKMSKKLAAFFKKLTDEGVGTAPSAIPYIAAGREKLMLYPQLLLARDELFRAIAKHELESRLASSQALYELLKHYERIYDLSVRRAGQLTFSDLVMLLAVNQTKISHRNIEYRLDGRFNHWLLDEFQDTNRLQWRVMEPLAEEVVWDPEERRSFFYVGDTKQAIYGWRGGDFKLFEQVREAFELNGGASIEKRELFQSWRSDKRIIEAINVIFDPARLDDPVNADFNLPDETIENWKKAWVEHKAGKNAHEGFAQLRLLQNNQDREDENGQLLLDESVLDILKETDPVGRGMTCAIIVRTRAKLDHYVALLRAQKPPIPVAAEGRVNPCLKTPESLALYALAKFLVSPIDRIAEAQFLGSPFGFLAEKQTSTFQFAALQQIAAEGLSATFSKWVREASRISAIDTSNAEAFLEATADYEMQRKGGEDLSHFLEFIDHRVQQDSETPGVVRVMTTHFSKGLGMDMVILPELGGTTGIADFRDTSGIALSRDSLGQIQWGLSLPNKHICAADPTLSSLREQLRARQAYEAFCVLYVAMTRAKHALYCLHLRGKDFKNPGRWLDKNFPTGDTIEQDARSIGDSRWFTSFTPKKVSAPFIEGTQLTPPDALPSSATPSTKEGKQITGDFILKGASARHLGIEVHELLASVEWLGDAPNAPQASPEARAIVNEFLKSDRATVLKKPPGKSILWREKPFAIEINGHQINGAFDRVLITLDTENKPACAEIIDFKTDQVTADLTAEYEGQLASYKKATALLLGIDEDSISAQVIGIRG